MHLIETTQGDLINADRVEAFTRSDYPDQWRARLSSTPEGPYVETADLDLIPQQPQDRLLPNMNPQLVLLRTWWDDETDETDETLCEEQPLIGWSLTTPTDEAEPVPVGMDSGFFRPALHGVLDRDTNRVYSGLCWQTRDDFIERAGRLWRARARAAEQANA